MADGCSQELMAFVPKAHLRQITCVEQSVRRPSVVLTDDADAAGSARPRFELMIHTPDEGDPPERFSIQVRLIIDFPDEAADAVVAFAAVYEHELPEAPSHELLTEFTNEVALMTLLPYIREALADGTRRVFGKALLMPMFQRGEVTFDAPRPMPPDS